MRATANMKRTRTVSHLRKLAHRTDIVETLTGMMRVLVQQGIDLPCTMTIGDGVVSLVINAKRTSATYDRNMPDEAFLIDITVLSKVVSAE
jgi:hypothetical protein